MKSGPLRLLLLSTSLFLLSATGCKSSKHSAPFDPTAFLGTWSGTWTNTTFSSTGAVSLVVAENGGVVTFTLDMDGNVFGGSDPAAEDFTASFSGSTATLDAKTSTVYGDVTGTLNSNGSVTIHGVNINGQVASFTLTGSWSGTQITANVSITFDNASTAAGNEIGRAHV